MAERTGVLTVGRRPPLGLLVFDDGMTYTVDSGYVIGRDPESDERVQQGGLRPLVLIDPQGAVSRRHAVLTLDGWNVLLSDLGSANGTFVAARGAPAWSALIAEQPIALQTSTRVKVGTRTFTFESPHGST
jgi:pSer/pThr/pTyr-binding forkhead associated (FHA) protein